MKKRVFRSLCVAAMTAWLFTACDVVDFIADQKPTASITPAEESGVRSTSAKDDAALLAEAGTYWKTTGFDGIENKTGDFWSDLFLWADGTGCFRFSQATPTSHYYGMHDVIPCDWASRENGSVTLLAPGTQTVLYTATVESGVLTIHYDGYADEAIRMEQTPMPPFGSHWTMLDLYGTWRMTAYTDAVSGAHTVAAFFEGDVSGNFASEITLDQAEGVHFWLADPANNSTENIRGMDMGYHDLDGTWHPTQEGPAWEGCINEAWHVELTGNTNQHVRFEVSYAGGKLLLKKTNASHPDSFPESFTAEYEYVGHRDDLGEGSGIDIVNRRFAEAAYSVVLHRYRHVLQSGEEADVIAERLVDYLTYDQLIEDGQSLTELYYSIAEPLSGNSNFGYAIRDINEDDMPELFILSEDDYSDDYTINAFYTLRNGRAVLVETYWARKRCALANDGTIHINGSSGADDSDSASFSLNARTGKLQLIEIFDSAYYPEYTTEAAGLVFIPFMGKSEHGASNEGGSSFDLEATHSFASIVGYNGKVYSIYASPEIPNFIGISGASKFTPLPEAIGRYLESEGDGAYVYNFTICDDRIYYLAAEPGSSVTSGAVYRCNLDGTRNERLVYANNLSTCMISNGWLYYSAETDGGDFIVSKVDLNKTHVLQSGEFPEFIEPGISTDRGLCYFFSDGTLYKKDIQTEATSPIMTLSSGPMNVDGDGVVMAVINDTVYYAASGEYSESGNTFLFGVSTNGGTGELLASWFAP